MERNSKFEHQWDFAMPKKKAGLMRKTSPKPLTKQQAVAQDNRDKGKSSLRKANEVPGASTKKSINRMQEGGLVRRPVEGDGSKRFAAPVYDIFRDNARLEAYTNKLEPLLAAKNKERWAAAKVGVDTIPSPQRRLAMARKLQASGAFKEFIPRKESNLALGADSTDYNRLAQARTNEWGLNVVGTKEPDTTQTKSSAFGLLNYAMAPRPVHQVTGANTLFETKPTYDIPTKKYTYNTTTTPLSDYKAPKEDKSIQTKTIKYKQ
jgi:hypothetical protein